MDLLGDPYNEMPMGHGRFHPGALLLLAVFSLQAVAPGVSGRLLLCIGCDGLGFAIANAALAPAPMAESPCCSHEDSAEEGLAPESAQERIRPSVGCGCMRIAIDRVELQIQPASAAPQLSGNVALLAAVEYPGSTEPALCGMGPRGPPGGSPFPIDQTPLTGRTCLLI